MRRGHPSQPPVPQHRGWRQVLPSTGSARLSCAADLRPAPRCLQRTPRPRQTKYFDLSATGAPLLARSLFVSYRRYQSLRRATLRSAASYSRVAAVAAMYRACLAACRRRWKRRPSSETHGSTTLHLFPRYVSTVRDTVAIRPAGVLSGLRRPTAVPCSLKVVWEKRRRIVATQHAHSRELAGQADKPAVEGQVRRVVMRCCRRHFNAQWQWAGTSWKLSDGAEQRR
jgi:hypothetical protein